MNATPIENDDTAIDEDLILPNDHEVMEGVTQVVAAPRIDQSRTFSSCG